MHIEDMHWFEWEAIVMQARSMSLLGFTTKALDIEVSAITRATQDSGVFSEDLRRRACLVEEALEPNVEAWQKAQAIEYEEMNREAEMYERNHGLQQGVSKRSGFHFYGA